MIYHQVILYIIKSIHTQHPFLLPRINTFRSYQVTRKSPNLVTMGMSSRSFAGICHYSGVPPSYVDSLRLSAPIRIGNQKLPIQRSIVFGLSQHLMGYFVFRKGRKSVQVNWIQGMAIREQSFYQIADNQLLGYRQRKAAV